MRRKNGFSLVELLAVIATLSLLGSLLLPALATVKERGWRARCINNQRQLGLTWLMYADDNRERLAQNGYAAGGGEPERRLWVQGHFNPLVSPADSTNELLLTDRRFAQFASYLGSSRYYRCPAHRQKIQLVGTDESPAGGVQNIRSYSMNWFLGWVEELGSRNPAAGFRRFYTMNDLQPATPSELIAFTDVHPESICWPFFGIPARSEFFMLPGSYHNRRGVIAWADGHVADKKWADPRTTGVVADALSAVWTPADWHRHQHSSVGNADVIWLQSHGSIPR